MTPDDIIKLLDATCIWGPVSFTIPYNNMLLQQI